MEASETSTLTHERHRPAHAARKPAFTVRFGWGPAALAGAGLLCLLAGLLVFALQIKAIFSDQLKQEYTGLVLDAIGRAESARDLASARQPLTGDNDAEPQDYRSARIALAARLASVAALVNADPAAAPHIAQRALSPAVDFEETDALLRSESTYWRTRRDLVSADLRSRIARVAKTLMVLSALIFTALVTALGMYAKRTRQLARESHRFEFAALHDALTGLPNRRQLFAMLAQTPPGARGDPLAHTLAVLYIDLDGFKQVNDSLGHRIGDEFLIAVARRFRESVRLVDVVARIGGDEFAVLVRGFSMDTELRTIAERLIACVVETGEQMRVGFVGASIGIASFPHPIEDYRHLLAAADETMYQVKRSGKNGYAFATAVQRAGVS
ncbi:MULTISPECIES: GGDEF domain-containing protein [Paraburkholderia]|jgi:diguanylate cyclase (GGDEF)-like protein|uniref:Diguanylate cyclase (GGDEF) domain-containing protein n=1 Tax=Paraburkholderia phenazinium TaxID=60549 RepID=A0A1N6KUB4_9BURK|nr:GGDEF domain-containing protein [Paraburkholderia phenazinium]SIO60119.1 diguanylate cyclase (GGDEF) domain-containing protein [Paraburkholderia phenazinium]